MLMKCHHHLNPLVKFKSSFVDQRLDEDCTLNIFEQTASTNEPTRELVDKEFLIFKIYQMDVKDMKCPFQW